MSILTPNVAPAGPSTGLRRPDDAVEWIESHVGPTAPLRWRKPKPWSLVACAETPDGVFWFKEVDYAADSEPALTAALAQRASHVLPEVVAAEGTRLLTRHAGPHVGQFIRQSGKTPTSVWADTVASYAELQIELVPIARRLSAFDARPDRLARTFGDVVAPVVTALGDAIPFSLVHLDLFKKNVCVGGDGIVLLDWAVPAYGHPFCGLHVILRGLVRDFGASPGGREVLHVRDTYLEPWTNYAPMGELRRIFAAANPLGALCRVMRWQRLVGSLPAGLRGGYANRADKWLERFGSSLEAPDRLGL